MKQKLLLFLIALLGWSTTARAQADGSEFDNGSGTPGDPWQITTATQLAALNNYLGTSHNDKYFEITKHIDLTEWLGADRGNEEDSKGWWPIGRSGETPVTNGFFFGHLDGGGYTVSGLWIKRDRECVGLFGCVREGSISNLTVEIAAEGVSGTNYTGGLAGYSLIPFTHCHVRGEGIVSGNQHIGGLAGQSQNAVSYCSSTVAVKGTYRVGGLIGYQGNGFTTSQSYATGEVTCTGTEAGGLVGFLSDGTIEHCYATGTVGAVEHAGGLLGAVGGDGSTLSQSYATGKIIGDDLGGLTGFVYSSGTLTLENCFYLRGSGTAADPWLIPAACELAGLNYFLGPDHDDKYFKITNDIDLTEWLGEDRGNEEETLGWWPIGRSGESPVTNGYFFGHLDGGGYTVSGLWIKRDRDNVGLFGCVREGWIRNLTVEIAAEGVTGNDFTGGLAGYSIASLTHCHVREEGKVIGGSIVGGLAGWSCGDVSYCSSTVAVKGTSRLGGLIGYQDGCTISQSCATGEVTATGNESGGLVGFLTEGGTLKQCYATGAVEATKNAGGLVGTIGRNGGTLSQSYATGEITGNDSGGLAGFVYDGGTLTFDNCFYLAETIASAVGFIHENGNVENKNQAFAHSEEELKQASTFTDQGWEFLAKGTIPENEGDNGWKITDGESTPWLWWERRPEPADPVSNYHTITLELAPGIWCSYAAGQLTVAETDHLHLQFYAEDPSLNAADLLFLVDGVETPFKVSVDGRAGSYILNPITGNPTLLIAQKEYPVTLPEVDGAVITPAAGTHSIPYGEPFQFSVSLNPLQDLNLLQDLTPLNPLKVFANGIELTPDETGQPQSLRYTIDAVTGPVTITLEGINPTGNGNIATGNIQLRITNYELQIENTTNQAVDVAVYTITGKSVVSLRALSGSKSIALPAGMYIVQVGTTIMKVIIP